MKKFLLIIVIILVLIPTLPVFGVWLLRPARTPVTAPLFEGVTYQRHVRESPRPWLAHLVEVDLTAPGVSLFVTPGQAIAGREIPARTTTEFLTEFDLQVAINASFFEPFHSNGLWDYYPKSGDPVDVLGLAISGGEVYSAQESNKMVLCVLPDGTARIRPITCPAETVHAVSGYPSLLEAGRKSVPNERGYFYASHPRTALALDESGQTLWLVVVDGRQAGYSEGVTLDELADLLLAVGAYHAFNLDGGGSTSMAVDRGWWPGLLNVPIHTRIPLRERPVANHLGVYARP